MRPERARIKSQCKGQASTIGSDWFRHFPGPNYTEKEREKKNTQETCTRKAWLVSHELLAVSPAMLCQSFLGTVVTLRYFWQSDHESLCSNVVGAMKWTKSPKLWSHEWQWCCKMRNELRISNLSPVFWWILCLLHDNGRNATAGASAQQD